MSISGFDSAVATNKAESSELKGFQRKLTRLNDRFSNNSDKQAELKKACSKFEAVFMGKIWKQMRKSIPKSELLNSKVQDQYVAMFDKEFSENLAKGRGIGIADMLYDQLKSKLDHASKSTLPGTGNQTAIKSLAEVGNRGTIEGALIKEKVSFNENGIPGIPLPKPGMSLSDNNFSIEQNVSRKFGNSYGSASKSDSPRNSALSRTEAMARIEELARSIEIKHKNKVIGNGATAEFIGKKLAGL